MFVIGLVRVYQPSPRGWGKVPSFFYGPSLCILWTVCCPPSAFRHSGTGCLCSRAVGLSVVVSWAEVLRGLGVPLFLLLWLQCVCHAFSWVVDQAHTQELFLGSFLKYPQSCRTRHRTTVEAPPPAQSLLLHFASGALLFSLSSYFADTSFRFVGMCPWVVGGLIPRSLHGFLIMFLFLRVSCFMRLGLLFYVTCLFCVVGDPLRWSGSGFGFRFRVIGLLFQAACVVTIYSSVLGFISFRLCCRLVLLWSSFSYSFAHCSELVVRCELRERVRLPFPLLVGHCLVGLSSGSLSLFSWVLSHPSLWGVLSWCWGRS